VCGILRLGVLLRMPKPRARPGLRPLFFIFSITALAKAERLLEGGGYRRE